VSGARGVEVRLEPSFGLTSIARSVIYSASIRRLDSPPRFVASIRRLDSSPRFVASIRRLDSLPRFAAHGLARDSHASRTWPSRPQGSTVAAVHGFVWTWTLSLVME
jgi:hypothetical protein